MSFSNLSQIFDLGNTSKSKALRSRERSGCGITGILPPPPPQLKLEEPFLRPVRDFKFSAIPLFTLSSDRHGIIVTPAVGPRLRDLHVGAVTGRVKGTFAMLKYPLRDPKLVTFPPRLVQGNRYLARRPGTLPRGAPGIAPRRPRGRVGPTLRAAASRRGVH